MKEVLSQYFQDGDDPRSERNQKHPFRTIIGTTLLAGLAGVDRFSGIADFTEAHLDNLKDYFDFPHGAPSHDTYRIVWDAINPQSFYVSFQSFTKTLTQMKSEIINVDGKTIRHSGEGKALHIVSAWCEANQLVLAQEKVDRKSNEITAIPNLLK